MSKRPGPKFRKGKPFALEALSGHQFADLTEAQRAALPTLAADIASSIRAMLASGQLVIIAGRVTVPPTDE